jgi:hypothetical protein
VPEPQIVLRHLLPNTLAPLLVQASFDMGAAITAVAGLSFIGFGVKRDLRTGFVDIFDTDEALYIRQQQSQVISRRKLVQHQFDGLCDQPPTESVFCVHPHGRDNQREFCVEFRAVNPGRCFHVGQ